MHLQMLRTSRIRLVSTTVSLVLLSAVCFAQTNDDTGALNVEEKSGAVRYRSQSPWLEPSLGQQIRLPAVISTGADGAIKLSQDNTVVAIAANTALEFFPGTESGKPIQRVVQSQGSAFYDIQTRESSRMRVETPYLVAVIKGTQFNVTNDIDSSTISLFEGQLQIEAPDIGDVVDLQAGQIARRHKNDSRITVISMENGEPIARNSSAAATSGEQDQGDGNADGGTTVSTGAGDTADVGIQVDVNGSDGGGMGVGEVAVSLPVVDAVIGTDLSAGTGKIDLGLDGNVSLRDTSIDLGLDTSISAGDVGAGLDAGLGVGDNSIDAGLDAGVDPGSGEIDLGLDTGVDVSDTSLDLGLDASANLGSGEVDLGLDSGIDTGSTPVDLDLGSAVDLGAGTIDVDLDVSVVDVDLDLDLGIDTGDTLDLGLDELVDDTETITTPIEDITDNLPDLGGLLGL
ncbi:MAG: FecR family protein [Woeseiaceae bacterium]